MENNLTIFLTSVIAIATFAYAVMTYHLLRETTRLRKVETEPLLAVYINPNQQNSSFADRVVENIGKGPAYNLVWSVNEDDPLIQLLRENRVDIPNMGFFKGWEFMAPGQRFTAFLDGFVSLMRIEGEAYLELTVRYENISREIHEQKFRLDPNDYRGIMYLGTKSFTDLVKVIEKISKTLKKIDAKIAKQD